MEWSNETILEFLDLYEHEPVIWHPSHSLHKNRNDIYDAWKKIQEKMSVRYSITDLKRKKESLMSSFRACLNKMKQSQKSGVSDEDIYKPKWFAFEKMASFLRTRDQPRIITTSEVSTKYIFTTFNNNIY